MLIVPHLILRQDKQILLTRRAITQKLWAGHWHCVTGGIEEGESPREAIIREAEEEIGIKVQDLNLVTTIFLIEKDQFVDQSVSGKMFHALELFFAKDLTDDQNPVNREPLKQDRMEWFDIDKLPVPMIPGVAFGLNCYLNNKNYAELRSV